jgi:diacylglycerol O-acyltransferase
VQSYDGHLDFGILADRDQMPDLWNFMDWLEASLSELQRIGRQLDIKPAAANS